MYGYYCLANTLIYLANRALAYTESPRRPPARITVVVPVWLEPSRWVEQCIKSLRENTLCREYPEMVEILGVDGIGYGEQYDFDRLIRSPEGKLNARHYGALQADGEIIASVDADTIYPPAYLDVMARHLARPGVVACTALGSDPNILAPLVEIPLILSYNNKILGRASMYWRWAYFASGGFDLTINQRDPKQLLIEEEYRFRRRLERIGRIALAPIHVKHLGYTKTRGIWRH